MELQRNMKYYDLLFLLPGPVKYYDVQKVFGMCCKEAGGRRSLEFAIDQLDIPKEQTFHRALTDARYTAMVLKWVDEKTLFTNYSMDVYQNPKKRKMSFFYPIRIMTNMFQENSQTGTRS